MVTNILTTPASRSKPSQLKLQHSPVQSWSPSLNTVLVFDQFSTGMLPSNYQSGKIQPALAAISDHLSSFQLTTNYLYWSHSFTFTPLPHYKLSIECFGIGINWNIQRTESNKIVSKRIGERRTGYLQQTGSSLNCETERDVWHVSWCKINICFVSLPVYPSHPLVWTLVRGRVSWGTKLSEDKK